MKKLRKVRAIRTDTVQAYCGCNSCRMTGPSHVLENIMRTPMAN